MTRVINMRTKPPYGEKVCGSGAARVGYRLFVCLAACISCAAQDGAVTTVSAANFRAPVAPESLASLFGQGLARGVVVAQLDSAGRLPLDLDGTQVRVNGRQASLVFVSPSQINFVIPLNTEIGTARVEVLSGASGRVYAGTVEVRTVAPALFSLDASGQGRGAIQNAVTFVLDPFETETPQNPGSDKITRLAIYGTGMRFAGNPQRDPHLLNSAARTKAELRDTSGRLWRLPVEYAGPTPGFFGLDQVNVALPPELDGLGPASVRIFAETVGSNEVTLTVRRRQPHRVSGITPLNVTPGGQFRILGAGFIDASPTATPRTLVRIETTTGLGVAVRPLSVTDGELVATAPPMVLDSQGTWYTGSARICVLVDERKVCAQESLNFSRPPDLSSAPGQVLLTWNRRLADAQVQLLRQAGEQQTAQQLEALNSVARQSLEKMVADAVANRPLVFDVPQADGSTIQARFDLNTLRVIETFLAGSDDVLQTAVRSMKEAARYASAQQLNEECILPEERRLEALRKIREAMHKPVEVIRTANYAALGVAALSCLNPASCVAVGVPIVTAVLPALTISAAIANWTDLLTQISIEYGGPNLLDSLEVIPATPAVNTGGQTALAVYGRMISVRGSKVALDVVYETLLTFFPIPKELEGVPVLVDVARRILYAVAKQLLNWVGEKAIDTLATPGSQERAVELSRRSVSVSAGDAGLTVRVSLRCGSAAGVISGVNPGMARAQLSADQDNLLLVANSAKTKVISVSVGGAYAPRLQASKPAYRRGEALNIVGMRFPLRTAVRTTLRRPSAPSIVFSNETDDAGAFSVSQLLDSGAPVGTWQVSARAAGLTGAFVTSFSVSDGAGPVEPGVLWVQPQFSRYKVGDRLVILYRTTPGDGSRRYDLMLRIASEVTGNNYYFYDDSSDPNSRWIHQAARPMWSGIPTASDAQIPLPGQQDIVIDESTPAGPFRLSMYFSNLGLNLPVGSTAVSAFILDTPALQGQCFIATAAFGSALAPTVSVFRRFRDERLIRSALGRWLVDRYYEYSPGLARRIAGSRWARGGVRLLLYPIALATLLSLSLPPGVDWLVFAISLCLTAFAAARLMRLAARWVGSVPRNKTEPPVASKKPGRICSATVSHKRKG